MENYWIQLKTIIDQSQKIVLTTHVRPDGDGLGAEAALFSYFESLGKIVRIINVSPLPEAFDYMNKDARFETFNTTIHAHSMENADCIIILDCNQLDRTEEMAPYIERTKGNIVVIDHHLYPGDFADLLCIDISSCATGEMVYDFITFHSGKMTVSQDAATGIYTSIMTDTGNFRFPRTTPAVHRKTAYLIESGVEPSEIYGWVNEQRTLQSLQLQGLFLSQIRTAYDGKLAYSVVKKSDFDRFGATLEDSEGFVKYLLSVKGVVMGILLIEQPYGYKLSFRSKGDIDVNRLASQYSGGGHKNASGGKMEEMTDHAIARLIADAEPILNAMEITE